MISTSLPEKISFELLFQLLKQLLEICTTDEFFTALETVLSCSDDPKLVDFAIDLRLLRQKTFEDNDLTSEKKYDTL